MGFHVLRAGKADGARGRRGGAGEGRERATDVVCLLGPQPDRSRIGKLTQPC